MLLQAGQEVHLAILLQPLGGHVPRQLGILLRKHLPSAWPGQGWGHTGQRTDREPSAPPFRLEGTWLTRVCPLSVQTLGPQRPFRGKVSWIHSSTHALQPVHMSTHLSIHPLIQKKKKTTVCQVLEKPGRRQDPCRQAAQDLGEQVLHVTVHFV